MDIWYNSLLKPELTPPDWLFAPVWGFIYLSIAVSFVTFINATGEIKDKIVPVILFSLQVLFNFLWTPVFFSLHNIELAFIILVFLIILLVLTIINFYNISKLSGIILIPYLVWCVFALYLNYKLLVLN